MEEEEVEEEEVELTPVLLLAGLTEEASAPAAGQRPAEGRPIWGRRGDRAPRRRR